MDRILKMTADDSISLADLAASRHTEEPLHMAILFHYRSLGLSIATPNRERICTMKNRMP